MRSRNIKPGFFENEILGSADPMIPLLFAGLWVIADREGRLEDRPLKIKGLLFRFREDYTSGDVAVHIRWLAENGFLRQYETASSIKLIQLNNWKKHQHPHHQEKRSTLPSPPKEDKPPREVTLSNAPRYEPNPEITGCNPSDSLIPDSLIPDCVSSDGPTNSTIEIEQPNSRESAIGCKDTQALAWLFRSRLKRRPNSQESDDAVAACFDDLVVDGWTVQLIEAEIRASKRSAETVWDFCKRLAKSKPPPKADVLDLNDPVAVAQRNEAEWEEIRRKVDG